MYFDNFFVLSGDVYHAPVNNTKYGKNSQFGGSRNTYHGNVNNSTHTTTYGNNAQVGGSRKIYHGPVDKSKNKTQYGDHAQVGGTRIIGSGKLPQKT